MQKHAFLHSQNKREREREREREAGPKDSNGEVYQKLKKIALSFLEQKNFLVPLNLKMWIL